MKPEYIIIHTAAHGDKKHNYDTSARDIDSWHRSRGWRGIGYHEVVRLDGTVEEGRRRNERGAHCTSMGMNSKSIGICFAGHGDHHHWTEAQERAGILLVAAAVKGYDIPVRNVLGHHETGARKTCPGKLVDMMAVRHLVSKRLGGDVEHPEPGIDYTGMFRNICDIFDNSNYHYLPTKAQVLLKELRMADPFDKITREDIS